MKIRLFSLNIVDDEVNTRILILFIIERELL